MSAPWSASVNWSWPCRRWRAASPAASLGAELTLSHRPEGLAARASVQLAGVNAAELLPGDGVVTGKLTLDAKAEGSGLSAVALMGSLAGDGTFKLENGRVVRLDPAAFDTVMRAVDQGLPIDATQNQRPNGCGARERRACPSRLPKARSQSMPDRRG